MLLGFPVELNSVWEGKGLLPPCPMEEEGVQEGLRGSPRWDCTGVSSGSVRLIVIKTEEVAGDESLCP